MFLVRLIVVPILNHYMFPNIGIDWVLHYKNIAW